MTDKMREGQLWSFVHDSLHEAYKKLSTTGTRDEYYATLDAIASKIADDVEARFLQAAKSVPAAPDYSVTQLQRLKSLMSELGLSTDESLEGFCLDADRQLSRAITAMHKALSAFKSVPVVGEVDCYDAGLLSDFGGGNVEWWQDYIRAELARAHEFYVGQSAPEVVPIVSKTVGYLAGGTLMRRKIQGYDCKPLIIQPTTSITTAELERLRKDAERYKWLRMKGAQSDRIDRVRYFGPKLDEAIDAAIAAEGEK